VIVDCLAIHDSSADDSRAHVARLLDDEATHDGDEGWFGESPSTEFRTVEAVVALVEELSARNPVAMAVEDLQWADPSSLLVLHRLGRRVRQLPLLLMCTARPVPRSAELDGCLHGLRANGATELVLGPLEAAAVAQMVEDLVDATPGHSLLRQVTRAGGNPLFVTELVSALQRDGAIELGPDGTAELPTVGIPPSLPVPAWATLRPGSRVEWSAAVSEPVGQPHQAGHDGQHNQHRAQAGEDGGGRVLHDALLQSAAAAGLALAALAFQGLEPLLDPVERLLHLFVAVSGLRAVAVDQEACQHHKRQQLEEFGLPVLQGASPELPKKIPDLQRLIVLLLLIGPGEPLCHELPQPTEEEQRGQGDAQAVIPP
jgi:hypothetical protein